MGPAHIFRHAQAGGATGGVGGGGLLARVQEVSWGRLRSGLASPREWGTLTHLLGPPSPAGC